MTNGTGTNMTLWSAHDPTFLQLATQWWSELLPRVAPFMWAQGGPVVMIQACSCPIPAGIRRHLNRSRGLSWVYRHRSRAVAASLMPFQMTPTVKTWDSHAESMQCGQESAVNSDAIRAPSLGAAPLQIANEYGMCGSDKQYLHELAAAVRSNLGRATVVYTTDPPWLLDKGSIAGPEVFTCVPTAAALARTLAPAALWPVHHLLDFELQSRMVDVLSWQCQSMQRLHW